MSVTIVRNGVEVPLESIEHLFIKIDPEKLRAAYERIAAKRRKEAAKRLAMRPAPSEVDYVPFGQQWGATRRWSERQSSY